MTYIRRALIPAVLLAIVLSGCAAEERGVELIPATRPVVSSIIFTPPPGGSQSFFSQYEEWLRNGTSGAPNAPSGPLEVILRGERH